MSIKSRSIRGRAGRNACRSLYLQSATLDAYRVGPVPIGPDALRRVILRASYDNMPLPKGAKRVMGEARLPN